MRNDRNCRDCIYSSVLNGSGKHKRYCCLYILHTGKSRGCEPGDKCTKKIIGERHDAEYCEPLRE